MNANAVEKAMERAGSNKLAQLLLDVVNQFITPLEDPVYDWQIVPLTRVAGTRMDGQLTWNVDLPEEIETNGWKAPVNQCALAWGTRMAPSRFHDPNAKPTPVAVLVRAVRGPNGSIHAEVGATFLWTDGDGRRAPSWFLSGGSLDSRISALIVSYLNSQKRTVGDTSIGIDLE